MPFRIRRSFGPRELKLNISKTGLSVSAGVRGAHVNYDLSGRRKKPVRMTVGLPGSGISYYEDLGSEKKQVPAQLQPKPGPSGIGVIFRGFLVIIVVYGIVIWALHAHGAELWVDPCAPNTQCAIPIPTRLPPDMQRKLNDKKEAERQAIQDLRTLGIAH